MKLDKIIKSAYDTLKQNKIKSALLDSELLLSKAIKKSREFIILNSDYNVEEKDYLNFIQMIDQRLKGKPVSYLIGKSHYPCLLH